eukprot:SAG11_NODE_175_length_13457_cov_42.095673_7_plen_71_part_00
MAGVARDARAARTAFYLGSRRMERLKVGHAMLQGGGRGAVPALAFVYPVVFIHSVSLTAGRMSGRPITLN